MAATPDDTIRLAAGACQLVYMVNSSASTLTLSPVPTRLVPAIRAPLHSFHDRCTATCQWLRTANSAAAVHMLLHRLRIAVRDWHGSPGPPTATKGPPHGPIEHAHTLALLCNSAFSRDRYHCRNRHSSSRSPSARGHLTAAARTKASTHGLYWCRDVECSA